jgi:hypothetical protein
MAIWGEGAVMRESFTTRLVAFFEARPYEWIDARELEQFGRQAWRTRVSNARTAHGLVLRNRQRKVNGYTVSEYRYEPPVPIVPETYDVRTDGRLF